jgi:hypothetical protein
MQRSISIAPGTDRVIRKAQQPGESYGATTDRLIARLVGRTHEAGNP